MSRAAFVFNPIKVTDPDKLKERVGTFMTDNGWDAPLWLETTEDDPGAGMCRQAVKDGCDVVFVAGGDGTVMAAAGAMAESSIPMAILPSGTGNLLARNLDLPISDEAECLRIGIAGRERLIDLAKADDKVFAVMAGLGFDAAIMRDAPEKLKAAVGWPAYIVSAAKHLRGRSIRVTLRIDEGSPVQRRVRTVLVGNVGKLQGNIPLLPDAVPDDGVLDVVLIATRSLLDWVRVAWRVLRRADHVDRKMERFTGKHVVIEASHPQPRQLDGDVITSSRTLDITVDPAALKVRVA